MAGSFLKAQLNGRDPISDVYPDARMVSPDVAASLIVPTMAKRAVAKKQAIEQDEQWQSAKQLYDSWMDLYKTRNAAVLKKITPYTPDDEIELLRNQLVKVEIPDDQQQMILTALGNMQGRLKRVDPSFNVMEDPETSYIAKSIGAKAGAGYFTTDSGEATDTSGGIRRVMNAGLFAFGEAVGSLAEQVANGAIELGIMAIAGHDSDFLRHYVGVAKGANYLDSQGNVVSSSGKVDGMQGPYLSWRLATGMHVSQIQKEANRIRGAMEWDERQSKGAEGYAAMLTSGLGSLGGFMATGGGTMLRMGQKGAAFLLASKAGTKLGAVHRVLLSVLGNSLGASMHEMMMRGNVEGYGSAFVEGMKMGPVFTVAGAMGTRAEEFLAGRDKMPKFVRRALSGVVEGLGLSTGDLMNFHSSLWQFMKNPNQGTARTWAQTVMASTISLGLFKAAHGRTPSQFATLESVIGKEGVQVLEMRHKANQALKKAAEKADTPEKVAEMSAAAGVSRETFGSYGQKLREVQAARSAEDKAAAEEQLQEIEDRLHIEAAGHDMTQEEREKIDLELRERIEELKQSGDEEGVYQLELARESLNKPRTEEAADEAALLSTISPMADQGEGPQAEGRKRSPVASGQEAVDRGTQVLSDLPKQIRGYDFEVKPMDQEIHEWAGSHEWILRDGDRIIGVGTIRSDGNRVDFLSADVNKAYQGHGIYSDILKEIAKRHPGGVDSSIAQSPAAKAAWRKAGMEPIDRPAMEFVEGKEPGRIGGPKPPETPEARERRIRQTRDPIEDPRFLDLPPEVQKEISNAPNATERKRIFVESVVERRGAEEPSNIAEAREVKGKVSGTPQSLHLGPQTQVEAVGGELTRPRDTLARMEGREGDPIRGPIRRGTAIKGRFSTKGILGWFDRFGGQIRLKHSRNTTVAAHEFSHNFEQSAIDAGLFNPNVPRWMRDAFTKAAETYPGIEKMRPRDRLAEGFAEFWARWLLDDPTLQSEVPDLHAEMMKWLSSDKMARFNKQMTEVQTSLRNERLIGAKGRLEAFVPLKGDKPTRTEKEFKPSLRERFLTAVTRSFFDDLIDLKKVQATWLKQAGLTEKDIPAEINPVHVLEALRMTAHRQAEAFFRDGTHDIYGNRTGESMHDILKALPEGSYADFIRYLVARRSLNINELSQLDTGLDPIDALAEVKRLERPEFIELANRIRAWADRLLDYAVEAGSLTRDEAAKMAALNPVYIPFQRDMTNIRGESPKSFQPGRGVAERGKGVKRFTGHEQAHLTDPMEALREGALAVITKAQQHMVMQSMYLQSKTLRKMAGFVTEVPRSVEPRTVLIEEIKAQATKKVKEAGGGLADIADAEAFADRLADIMGGPEAALTFFFQRALPSGSRPIVAFRPNVSEAQLDHLGIKGATRSSILNSNGKIVWLEVDPVAYNTLMGIDGPKVFLQNASPLLRGLLLTPSMAVRAGATAYNPDFVIRNMIRDPLTAAMFTQSGNGNSMGPLSAYAFFLKGAAERWNGSDNAEHFTMLGLEGSTVFGTEFARSIRGSTPGAAGVTATIGDAARAIGEFLSKPETFVRQAEFSAVREAALERGASMLSATLEAMLAAKEVSVNFTRAGSIARGVNQMVPYFAPGLAGIRKFWRGVSGVEGQEMQKQAILRGIMNIGGLSALVWLWHRNDEWYQDLPTWRRMGYWNFKIGEQVVTVPKPFEPGALFGNGTEAFLEALVNHNPEFAEDAALNLASMHLIGFPLIPAVLLPGVEAIANYSFFQKKALVPEWMQSSRLPEDQFTAYTTESAKFLGRALGVPPIKIENLLTGYSGGMVTRAMRFVEELAGLRKVEDWTRNIPAFGTLLTQSEHKQSKAVDRVYELATMLQQRAGSGVLTPAETSMRPMVNAAKEQIGEVGKLVNSGTISGDEGNRRKYEIAKRVVEAYNERTR